MVRLISCPSNAKFITNALFHSEKMPIFNISKNCKHYLYKMYGFLRGPQWVGEENWLLLILQRATQIFSRL